MKEYVYNHCPAVAAVGKFNFLQKNIFDFCFL
jgi:hypothetical protein